MHKKTTNSRILVVVVKWRHRAIVLLWKYPHFLFGETYFILLGYFYYGVGIHKRKEDFLKKKGCNIPFKLLKGMAKFIVTVKNKSRISLVKLVTIISVISSNKGNHFLSRSFRRVATFSIYLWNFIATFGGWGLLLWELYGTVRLSEKVVKDGVIIGTSRSALQGNRAQRHYSRLKSSDDLLVSWSGRGVGGVLLFMTAST